VGNTLADDEQERAAGAEPVQAEPAEAHGAEDALATARRLAAAAERFGRAVEDPGATPADPGADPQQATVPVADHGAEAAAPDAGPGQADGAAPAGSPAVPVYGELDPQPDEAGPVTAVLSPVVPAQAGPGPQPSAHSRHRHLSGPADRVPVTPGRGSHARGDLAPAVRIPAGLTTEQLVRHRRRAPSSGWRKAVYLTSLGLVRLPPGPAERRRLEQISRVRTPVASGHHRVAVISMKGGVGKTTTTVVLGSMLASLRADRVIALDASPDRGTLSDKLAARSDNTIRDLLEQQAFIDRYADVRGFTSQTATRLEVLASDQDPAATSAFGEADYCSACAVLERFYSVCITDCGTGLLNPAMPGVLRMTDQVLLVTTPSVDCVRSGSATLDWLSVHGYDDLASNAVVVLNALRQAGRRNVNVDLVEEHFAARCRAVVRVPYDPYLDLGAEVELDQLGKQTAEAFLALAAVVGEGFAWRRAGLEPVR
jgi:MinD-like ATPase involved in chromosome partitioning or flagellar assembly